MTQETVTDLILNLILINDRVVSITSIYPHMFQTGQFSCSNMSRRFNGKK